MRATGSEECLTYRRRGGDQCPDRECATITVDAPQTLGTLLLGDSAAAGAGYTLTCTGSNTLTLNNSGNGATITRPKVPHAINWPLVLNDSLTVNNNASLTLGGAIANGSNGPMGITSPERPAGAWRAVTPTAAIRPSAAAR